MGWKLKAVALFFAIILFPFAWLVSILLLVYVFSSFIFRRKKQSVVVVVPTQQGANPANPSSDQATQGVQTVQPSGGKFSGKSATRYFIGAMFLLLAAVAISERGTYSPVVFGSVGLLLIAWGPFSKVAQISVLGPVIDSILLRPRIPFLWVGLAEVKLATQQPARPVSSIRERVMIFTSPAPAMCVVIQRLALNHRSAEEKVMTRMREIEKGMAPLGAYLLPLDSSKSAEMLTLSLKDLKIDAEKWRQNLSSVHYDVLTMKPKDGLVRSFAAYVKDGGKAARPRLPRIGREPGRPPLLWEVLYQVGMRVRWATPDAYTAFLSSMEATENSLVGERITNMGSPEDTTVHVKAVGSPTVELSRPELRAVVRIYSPPVKEGVVQTILERIHV